MAKLLTKKAFKEKVVLLYEALLEGKEPFVNNDNFWDEFFLLKANVSVLESELKNISYVKSKNIINLLSTQCIIAIKSDNQIRVTNGLITLCSISKTISEKLRSAQINADLIDYLIGLENIELKFQILIDSLCSILMSDVCIGMKTLVLNLFLTLVTAYDNINENPLLEYLMSDQLFDAIIQLLNVYQQRQHIGYKTILLLTILVNYRKYESANPYIMKLSIVDEEIALSVTESFITFGYAQVVANDLLDFKKKFDQLYESKSRGIFNALTNMVGNMFIADDNGLGRNDLKTNNAVLLAFYEAVHLNRNFITLLTNSPTDVYPTHLENSDTANTINEDALEMIQNPPSNLLVAFLEFSSIVMLHTKDEVFLETSRLCFIILTCITEDHCANAIMHDINMAFQVQLHRMPMRHRKLSDSRIKALRPLSYSVMDLMVEFILTHMRKNLLLDLYLLCIGVIHRLLCYQKKCKIRVDYAWKELWTALIVLLKFILNNEADLIKRCNIFVLALNVINIFNLFITFGDTFLPSPQTYDELYYEIIRMHSIFEQLYSMTLRHVSSEGGNYKDMASKLSNSLVNIKAIINHFNAKIESWSSINQISSLTEEQVLEIVRNNYDSLTLKLHDNLDQYDHYDPLKNNEALFLSNLLIFVIKNYRKTSDTTLSTDEQHQLMQELQLQSNFSVANEEHVCE